VDVSLLIRHIKGTLKEENQRTGKSVVRQPLKEFGRKKEARDMPKHRPTRTAATAAARRRGGAGIDAGGMVVGVGEGAGAHSTHDGMPALAQPANYN
jgi:hypothetical protein